MVLSHIDLLDVLAQTVVQAFMDSRKWFGWDFFCTITDFYLFIFFHQYLTWIPVRKVRNYVSQNLSQSYITKKLPKRRKRSASMLPHCLQHCSCDWENLHFIRGVTKKTNQNFPAKYSPLLWTHRWMLCTPHGAPILLWYFYVQFFLPFCLCPVLFPFCFWRPW